MKYLPLMILNQTLAQMGGLSLEQFLVLKVSTSVKLLMPDVTAAVMMRLI